MLKYNAGMVYHWYMPNNILSLLFIPKGFYFIINAHIKIKNIFTRKELIATTLSEL